MDHRHRGTPWGGTHLDMWPSRRRELRAGQSRRNANLKAEQLGERAGACRMLPTPRDRAGTSGRRQRRLHNGHTHEIAPMCRQGHRAVDQASNDVLAFSSDYDCDAT
eukprot:1069916-Prymnesium_polylepis.1